jgi:hypothetical protein
LLKKLRGKAKGLGAEPPLAEGNVLAT